MSVVREQARTSDRCGVRVLAILAGIQKRPSRIRAAGRSVPFDAMSHARSEGRCAAPGIGALLGAVLALCAAFAAAADNPAWQAYQRGDVATAERLYREQAQRGDHLAEFNYAMMLFRREAVSDARGDAVRWLRRAAEGGLAQAQHNLALLYERGAGVEKSLTEATAWFRRAAEQGHRDAQVNLATQYYLGRGAPRGYAKAAQWYREAANGGDVGAQYILASMYKAGLGVPQDLRIALYWYSHAARQGDRAAAGMARELAREIDDAR